MRVDSIIPINANPQQSPRTRQYGSTATDKTVSGISFEDHFRASLQQVNNSTAVSQAENQLAGLLVGYFSNLRVLSKTESKLKENAG